MKNSYLKTLMFEDDETSAFGRNGHSRALGVLLQDDTTKKGKTAIMFQPINSYGTTTNLLFTIPKKDLLRLILLLLRFLLR